MDDTSRCPFCDGTATLLGVLGRKHWLRCQECGLETSVDGQQWEGQLENESDRLFDQQWPAEQQALKDKNRPEEYDRWPGRAGWVGNDY